MDNMDDISNLIKGRGAVVSQRVYHISGSQLNELIQTWKKAGKREVVDYLDARAFVWQPKGEGAVVTISCDWQAKLKEWGIDVKSL